MLNKSDIGKFQENNIYMYMCLCKFFVSAKLSFNCSENDVIIWFSQVENFINKRLN